MAEARPYRLLLAIDGSVHANRATAYVAERLSQLRDCEVHVAFVRSQRILGLLTAPQNEAILQAGTETEAARRMLDAAGIGYQFHSELGDPVRAILGLIRSQACNEAVVGSRGMSALDGLTLGSVAYKSVHEAPVPVTVVPNPHNANELDLEDGGKVHRILLAADGSKESGHAIDYVCGLRDARVPVQIRLLNVQLPIASGNVRRFISQDDIDNFCRQESESALASAKQALHAAGLDFESHMRVGHPAETIAGEAQLWGCTRIVMGTRGLGALANLVVGSTALQVLHRSEIPVTLVK